MAGDDFDDVRGCRHVTLRDRFIGDLGDRSR
jgi:hypothetical protein